MGDTVATTEHAISLLSCGNYREAGELLRTVHAEFPANRTVSIALSTCEYKCGRLDDAIAILEDASLYHPHDGRVHLDLGYYFFLQKRYHRAARSFRLIPEQTAEHARATCFLAESLIRSGELGDAMAVLDSAEGADALLEVDRAFLLSLLHERTGAFGESLTRAKRCVALAPDARPYRLALARALVACGDADGALDAYQRASELAREAASKQALDASNYWIRLTRLELLREQFAYLAAEHGHKGSEHGLLDEVLNLDPTADGGVVLSGDRLRDLAPVIFGFARHVDADISSDVSPVRETIDWSNIRDQVCQTGIAIVDDFLNPAGLQAIKKHLDGSIIWHNDQFARGYVSSMVGEGLEHPTVLKTAIDLRTRCPDLFSDHPMSTAWAFRYGRDAKGVEAHADYSIYTVNLWITDEASNKDPSTGGMLFYDVEADSSRDFNEYNADCKVIDEMIRKSAVRRRAPYKGNRAVIFRSSIFHASENIAFHDGFVNNRINLTLGFGYR